MKKSLYLSIIFLIIILNVSLTSAWWDGNWSNRKEINITNYNENLIANYSIFLNISYDSDMRNDFGDLRFIDSDDLTVLGYWFKNNSYIDSNNVELFVNIGDLTNKTIYMYYKKSGETTTSNIEKTFFFADDFNDNSLNTTKWSSTNLVATEFNNKVQLNHTTGNAYFYSKIGVTTTNRTWEYGTSQAWSIDGSNYAGFGVWKNGITTPLTQFYINAGSKVYTSYNSGYSSVARTTNHTDWIYKRLILNTTSANFYENDVLKATITSQLPAGTDNLPITFYLGSSGIYHDVDWAYITPVSNIEPTIIYGSEESIGGDSSPTSILSRPVDLYTIPNGTITFECNATDDFELTNITWYLWNSTSLYNSSEIIISGINNSTTFEQYFDVNNNGIYKWNCLVYDNSSQNDWSVNRTIIITDITKPLVSIMNYPKSPVEYSFDGLYSFNATIIDNGIIDNVLLEFNNINYTASLINSFYNVSLKNLNIGQYNYRWFVNDSYGNVNNTESGIYKIYNGTWWNSSWFNKKKINITTIYSNLANYTVLLNVTWDSGMMNNFSDLRFIDKDSELYYWFNNNTVYNSNSVLVWVKLIRNLTSELNMTIDMYYNNSLASSVSNITKTFLLGDDFDFYDTNLWTSYAGVPILTFSNSILNLSYNIGVNNVLNSWELFEIDNGIEVVSMTKWGLDDGLDSWWFGFDNKTYPSGYTYFCLLGHQPESPTSSKKYYACYNGDWSAVERTSNLSIKFQELKIQINESSANFYEDNILKATITSQIPTLDIPVWIGLLDSTGGGSQYYDWLYVRESKPIEPNYIFGIEETYSPYNVTPTPSDKTSMEIICDESGNSMADAAVLAGLLLTILLVGLVLGTLVASVMGYVDIERIGGEITLENAVGFILIIGLTYLVIATMAFLILNGICPAYGG